MTLTKNEKTHVMTLTLCRKNTLQSGYDFLVSLAQGNDIPLNVLNTLLSWEYVDIDGLEVVPTTLGLAVIDYAAPC